jgi:hypothetical protein
MEFLKILSKLVLTSMSILTIHVSAAEFSSSGSRPERLRVEIVPIEEMEIPEFLKEKSRREIQQMRLSGAASAEEEEVNELDNYLMPQNRRFLREQTGFDDLSIDPADISLTLLEGSRLLASANEGTLTAKGWTGLTRVFQVPGLNLVLLSELDIRASDAYFTIPEEGVNEEINGSSSIFTVKESATGKAISTLLWFTPEKRFILKTSMKVYQNDVLYDRLISIAASLQ